MRTVAPIVVREAEPGDAAAIRGVALAAWRATYDGLLDADVVERFLAQAYTEERIALRIERHAVFVAGVAPVSVEAYVECAEHDDHVQVVAIYALPDARGRGLGSALLAAVVAAHPGDDLAADVLIGNALAEPFYAARGFVPGETLIDELAGTPITERRWWLRANDRA
jgi:GNAT superfamily N-acetyltransferase